MTLEVYSCCALTTIEYASSSYAQALLAEFSG
jgi:hypothetical protein